MTTYLIKRFCFNENDAAHRSIIRTGLTLEEAQEHCNDSETSSSTASAETLAEAGINGPWFDGYEEE